MASGQCIRVFGEHKNTVNALWLSMDGHWALSGNGGALDRENSIRLWDVTTGRAVYVAEGHRGPVNSVCLSADARWVLSGSADGILHL